MKSSRVIVVALALMLASTPPSYGQQSAEELYQAGLHQEEVQGNPESAIEVYERILEEFPDNRAVNAKAQLHIGLCYEKLGLTEAQRAYQRVIDGYPERQDEVAVARERLAKLTQALAELERKPRFRKIEIASNPQAGVLSPDGNMLAFPSDGALWAVPLHGKVDPDIAGEPVRLADVPGVWPVGSMPAWSADGEWIAVNYQAQDDDHHVYLIPAAGGEPRVVQMPVRGRGWWNYRVSLSPDGQQVAISTFDPAGQEDIWRWSSMPFLYSTPTAGGELRRMASVRGEQGAFSPDGKFIAFVGPRRKRDWPEGIERKQPDLAPYDTELWVVPTAGGGEVKLATVQGRLRGPVWSPDGRFVAIHHEPGQTMASKEIWVYPLSPDASSAGEPIKISLPRPSFNMLAGWTPDDELGVFVETDLQVSLYTVPASGGPAAQLTSDGIPHYPRWSPDGERIYLRWIRPDDDPAVTPVPIGGAGLASVPAAGGDVVEIGQSFRTGTPGAGHNVSPDGERIVIFGARRGDSQPLPDVWTFPLDEGRPIRLTNDESSERNPCWSPDGRWVAFVDTHERSEDDGFEAIHLVSAEGGQISQISSESDGVGAGAIAFSPDGERIAFFSAGAIKTIPVQGGQPEVLVAEVSSGRHSQLEFSPDGSRIAHNAGGKIWITPLDGGVPEELRTGLPADADLREVSWSPNGERIVFMALIGGDSEFFLISDFLREER